MLHKKGRLAIVSVYYTVEYIYQKLENGKTTFVNH